MLNLPKSTEFNRIIPRTKFFNNAISSQSLREVYDEQISRVVWRNKLSKDTYEPYANLSASFELEIFEIGAAKKALDKRLLRRIDQSIPYRIFHVVRNEKQYQAWIADKKQAKRSIQVQDYYHTGWLSENDFKFSFVGKSPDETLHCLIGQIKELRNAHATTQSDRCRLFMDYFITMKMSRSYKPVLIIATVQSGGSITLEKAALQFMRFYQGRAAQGLHTENGYCVYEDKTAPISKVYTNLITMPIKALCGSGFFTYDSENRVFSFADDIYENLTPDEIDRILMICRKRLNEYLERVR